MTQRVTPVRDSDPHTSPLPDDATASFGRVLRDQRKVILVAVVLIVADYWILIQLDEWTLAGCIAGGIGLGLVNHLATEFWLLRLLVSGEQPTKKNLAMYTITRLAVLS